MKVMRWLPIILVVAFTDLRVSGECQNLTVSSEDFACAGFARDTVSALQEALQGTGYSFCTREEIAMFLGQTRHEGGEDATRQEETCVEQGTCDPHEFDICSWDLSVQPTLGKHYRGRGPIQISYSCNYKLAGDVLGQDLLVDPDMVLKNDTLSWGTALWFWNLNIGGTTAHAEAGKGIFGNTTRLINGALECDSGPQAKHQLQRVAFFLDIAKCMDIDPSGSNLFCSKDLGVSDLPVVDLSDLDTASKLSAYATGVAVGSSVTGLVLLQII